MNRSFPCFVLLLLAAVLFVQCSKKNNTAPYDPNAVTFSKDTIFYTTSPELVADFYFKPGTYWIYRDSITGQVDSFHVDSTAEKAFNDFLCGMHTCRPLKLTYFVMYISQSTISGGIPGAITLSEFALEGGVGSFGYFSSNHEYDAARMEEIELHSYLFVYPNCLSENTDTFTSNGTAYPVFGIFHNPDTVINNSYLLTPGTGIVKMRLHNTGSPNYVWELQRSHIVQ